jgi:aminopeptidase N
MDAPILNFYAFLSARYVVRKDRWRNVAIEVYHHPGHEYNLERMLRATRDALAYNSREFGPYQHRQLRIVEFPRYGEFAQSFDNTVPYSEAIGFIAEVKRHDIDYPYFVTAHEVAHQWWGHQVAPADVQGGSMLSETLAEYSALMVMEKRYGRAHIGRFLRYELDQYLKGRGSDERGEQPLYRVENQQYIHYNKGALAMYALRDYLGEERVNTALRGFLREWRFRGPPYPTSLDLLRHLDAAAPDSLRPVVDDLFRQVTLWENRVVSARLGTGTRADLPGYRPLTLRLRSRKLHADSLGYERQQPLDDWVEVGAFAGDSLVYLRKHHFRAGQQTLTVWLPVTPDSAGIDPQHKLIDRIVNDNVMAVTLERPRRTAPRDSAAARAPRGAARTPAPRPSQAPR